MVEKGDTAIVQREQSQAIQTHQLSKEQKELIKRTVAKGSTDDELTLFIHYCQKAGVDPLRKQAHFIKRRDGSTTMMIGIDGFQAKATTDPRYEGIVSQAVRENDEFTLNPVSGEVKHIIRPKERGKVVGAYAILKRKGMNPAVIWVDFGEYVQDSFIWKTKPEVMITKTARATLLRREYPDVFSGVYEPSEFGMDQTEDGDIIEPQEEKPKKPLLKTLDESKAEREKPIPASEPVDADYTDIGKDDQYHPEGSKPEPEEKPVEEKKTEKKATKKKAPKVPEKGPEPEAPKTPKVGDAPEPTVHIPIDHIKPDMKPRIAYTKILNHAVMRQELTELRELIKEIYPPYEPGTMYPYNIPEESIIEIVRRVSGITLKSKEKAQKCKDCGNEITEPESEEQDGLCLKHWNQRQ